MKTYYQQNNSRIQIFQITHIHINFLISIEKRLTHCDILKDKKMAKNTTCNLSKKKITERWEQKSAFLLLS